MRPTQSDRNLAALAQVALMFIPALPAYLWLWPSVNGTIWWLPVQTAVYVYFLIGTLWIGLRRWSLGQLGLNRQGIGLSLACGVVFLAGRTLVLIATDIPLSLRSMTLAQWVVEILFYFACVGLAEELLFRGLIYRALHEWRGSGAAIWGSAFCFGLYHMGGAGILGLAGGLVAGVLFGAIRWRAGGIVGLVPVHALIDLAAIGITTDLSAQRLAQTQIISPAVVILGYALILGVPAYLWKAAKPAYGG